METTTPEELRDELIRLGLDAGLERVGVCTADPFDEVRDELQRRRGEGLSARLGFTFREPERSTDVRSSFPWAIRLVVGGRAYLPAAGDPGPPEPGTGRIARFTVDDAYQPLRAGLGRIADRLAQLGHRAEVLVDDDRLVDRAAAVRAGIGWWGKNTMVLAPGQGPWMLIGSVATDAPLAVTEPMTRDCGTCSACLPACPTGALVEPGVLDARRCLAALAQLPGDIPRQFREAMGDRLYGCDDCIEACPPGSHLLARSEPSRGRVDLVELLTLPDADLLARFERFYVPRRQARFLRRNALVALGNTATDEHLPVLAGYAGHPDALLRRHAVWALGRLGTPRARRVVDHVAATDPDPSVRQETLHA